MQLEKTNSTAMGKLYKNKKTLSPLKKIKVSKQKYDAMSKEHFSRQLNEMHPAQKVFLEKRLLKKFTDF